MPSFLNHSSPPCTYLYIYNTYINIHFCSKHMHSHSQTEKTCRSPVVGLQVSQTIYNTFTLWTDRFVNKDTFFLSYITREMSTVFFDIWPDISNIHRFADRFCGMYRWLSPRPSRKNWGHWNWRHHFPHPNCVILSSVMAGLRNKQAKPQDFATHMICTKHVVENTKKNVQRKRTNID